MRLRSSFLIAALLVISTLCTAAAAEQSAQKLGLVRFPVSCTAAVQDTFNRGVALLHSFWYEEALKSFQEVVKDDPSCAMGYWGIAMTYNHPLWEPPDASALALGLAAARKAAAAQPKTQRERDYVAAVSTFYEDADRLDHRTRSLRYEQAMARLAAAQPQDLEASVFYALSLDATAPLTDKTFANQKKAAAILEPLFVQQPDHPGIVHYLIHSYDNSAMAEQGLKPARLYAKIAPSVPHALHMPSHIFTRLGLWSEVIDSNLAAAAAGKEHSAELKGATYSDTLHSFDYLEYAYLQTGQFDKAKEVRDEVASIQHAAPQNLPAAYAFAAVPARYAIEMERWGEAADLVLAPASFPWNRYPQAQAVTYFARAMGAARSGQVVKAAEAVKALDALQRDLANRKDAYWSLQVHIQAEQASGWLAAAQGRNQDALALLQSAAQLEDGTEKHPVTPGAIVPAHETLADFLMQLHRPKEALAEYRIALHGAPNRRRALAGVAEASRMLSSEAGT